MQVVKFRYFGKFKPPMHLGVPYPSSSALCNCNAPAVRCTLNQLSIHAPNQATKSADAGRLRAVHCRGFNRLYDDSHHPRIRLPIRECSSRFSVFSNSCPYSRLSLFSHRRWHFYIGCNLYKFLTQSIHISPFNLSDTFNACESRI